MKAYTASVPPPSDDKRWKSVMATMRRHGSDSSALIEVLHSVQEVFGFLDDDYMRFVAASLRLPLSKVYGVATFYHFFSLKPAGEHTCVVCMGTACYVRGAGELLRAIEEVGHVKAGGTTADNKVSVVAARCIGSCGLAPAVVYDGDVIPKAQPEDVKNQIRRWMGHDA